MSSIWLGVRPRRPSVVRSFAAANRRHPQDKAGHKPRKVNTTDPQSGVMSTAKGFVQGYNAQAVANDEQVVVCAEVTDEHNDLGQLHPMIAGHRHLAGRGRDRCAARDVARRCRVRLGGELRRPRRR